MKILYDFLWFCLKKKQNVFTKLTFLHEIILSDMRANFRWYMYEIVSIPHNCDFLCLCFKKYSEKSSCFHTTEIFFEFVQNYSAKIEDSVSMKLCFYLILCTNFRPLVEVLVRITQILKIYKLDHIVYKCTE